MITLLNFYLTSNPIKVVRSSGTALSCHVSLGYDIPCQQVEKFFKGAANKAGLKDPFVQIVSLGDFSMAYKAAGFYENMEHLLSTKSALKASVLDSLHKAGVEIVSPAFMNQRVLDAGRSFLPQQANEPDISAANIFPETIIFAKTNQAKKLEMLEEKRQSLLEQIKEIKNTKPLTAGLQAHIDQLESQVKIADALLESARRDQAQE